MRSAESDFASLWKHHYGDAPPFGHELRLRAHAHRFYALPDAKRYATTPEEQTEILRRANAIGDALFAPNQDVWRVHCVHLEASHDSPEAAYAATLPHIGEVIEPRSEERFRVHAIQERWESGKHDALLQDLAEDVVAYVLFFGTSEGSIFAPYDGGFDVCARTPRRTNRSATSSLPGLAEPLGRRKLKRSSDATRRLAEWASTPRSTLRCSVPSAIEARWIMRSVTSEI